MSYLKQYNQESQESFSCQNEAEEVAKNLLGQADKEILELNEKLEKFKSFFFNIDSREPDSVMYACRDSNIIYDELVDIANS